MASVHEYKRFENTVARKTKHFTASAIKGLRQGVKAFFSAFARQYTIVLVPHSEKKVYNLQVSVLSFSCVLFIIAGIVGICFWYGASYNTTKDALAVKDSRLRDTQGSLDQLRDEVARLLRQTKGFRATLSSTLASLGADAVPSDQTVPNSGDLSAFFDVRETAEGTLREVDDIRQLADYLAQAEGPVKEIGTLLSTQSALLKEIPNIWPIRGGMGHVSMYFGQNVNPFTGLFYIHKGIDLSTYRSGDPVLATADGQVVTMDYDPGYGYYIIIKHKHGFYTRYAHLQSYRTSKGQRVQQGDIIGYIGSTGLSTGPHLHYEVHIGSDVVDPYKYLNIRSNLNARPK